jgi:hypothetical protein
MVDHHNLYRRVWLRDSPRWHTVTERYWEIDDDDKSASRRAPRASSL